MQKRGRGGNEGKGRAESDRNGVREMVSPHGSPGEATSKMRGVCEGDGSRRHGGSDRDRCVMGTRSREDPEGGSGGRKENVRRGDGDSVVTYPGAARADVVGRERI